MDLRCQVLHFVATFISEPLDASASELCNQGKELLCFEGEHHNVRVSNVCERVCTAQ